MTDLTWRYRFTIDHVHDGDTVMGDIDLGMRIWRHKATVRIFGFDAPELKDEKAFGVFASQKMATLHPAGAVVWLTSQAFDDKYGRVLGDFATDACPSVAALGQANGWLRPYTGEGPKPWKLA